ncbi:MAG: alkaline phosphatase family protein [Anaerolineae bacterium]|nr:alkaline phosphatase family protein [Anaerolineae bacterium]MDW8068101.1 alkaline phosphatase family protein [Anaerolineae bacterium]
MARVGKILLLVLVLLILAAIGYQARKVAVIGWESVVGYQTPYLTRLPRGSAAEPLARRVVLVLVDGLRLDVSRNLARLNELQRQGAALSVRVGQPSLSYPSWTVIASGAWQEVSGVTTNWHKEEVQVDTVFRAARDAGMPVVVVGGGGWEKLYGSHLTEYVKVPWPEDESAPPEAWARMDEESFHLAIRVLEEHPEGLILVYFGGTDKLAHQYGVGSQYREEVQRVDASIGRLAEQLDPENDVLIVTADHGHVDRGGHGGWEPSVLRVPLVMVGKAIRPGVYTERLQVDIAPTIAALLGLPIPVHAQGRPLVEMLDAPADVKGRIGVNAGLQLVGFYDAYAHALGVRPFAGEVLTRYRERLAQGEEGALSGMWAEITARAQAARAKRFWRERLLRLPLALGIALLPVLYLLLFRRRLRQILFPLSFALIYFVFYNALFFGQGYTWSLSAFNSENQIKAFFNERLLDAALSFIVAGLLLSLASWKQPLLQTLERMVTFAFFVGYLLLLQVDLFYWLYDIRYPWALPDLRMGFKCHIDLLQMMSTGLLGVVLAPLGVLVGWGMQRWRKTQVAQDSSCATGGP